MNEEIYQQTWQNILQLSRSMVALPPATNLSSEKDLPLLLSRTLFESMGCLTPHIYQINRINLAILWKRGGHPHVIHDHTST